MGVSYTAYAVIGVKIDPALLYTVEKVRSCKHDIDINTSYCHICGLPMFKNQKKPIAVYNPNENEFAGLKVIFSTDRDEAFVTDKGYYSTCKDSYYTGKSTDFTCLDGLNLEMFKNNLCRILFPFGLYDPDKFGLWSVLYCSY